MIKNIKYKILLIIIILSGSSCNKWLELKPQDGIVREDFWKTKEQLQSAVVGCYSSLLSGALVQNLFIWGELRADMVSTTAFSTINEVDYKNAEILSTNSLTNWSLLYSTINLCNTVIEYGPEVIKSDNTLTQQQLDAYLGEARALRAMMYFYLLRIWGEVPLQLKSSSSDSKIEQLAKSTQTEVFNQIISDLDFAALNAPTTYSSSNPGMDKGRITKYTVYALQADAYLWMDKYEECIAACDKVINSNRFGLTDGSIASDWYSTLYERGNSTESIFEVQFDAQALNPWFGVLAQPTRRFESSIIVPDLFGYDLDPNKKDIRGDGGSYRISDAVIWKHVGTSTTNTVAENQSYRHWFVYRYADILLMKAEACAWSNKGQEALGLIDNIRARAQALPATAESPDPTDATAVSDYILRERSREFAFEGKRWYDLLRHAKRNNYAHLDLITDAISMVAPPDKQQSMISKFKDVRSHYLPIIITELQADKKLVQNPFYN